MESRKKSNSSPLVSIITPVYNGEHFLEQTIQSVLKQTYPNIEYILIDGGSTDGSVDIIKRYEKRLAYWVSEKDKGISDAFNKGIRAATGEIIGIINADDWYEPDAVMAVVQQMGEGDILYGKLQYHQQGKEGYIFSANHKLLNREMTLNHPATFIKKAVYDRLGLYSLEYKCAMDYEFFMRCYINQERFLFLDKKLSNMRLQGMSDINWTAGFREVKKVKDQYLRNKTLNQLYYIKQVFVTGLGRGLTKMGLSPLVEFYRKRLSPIKKVM